MYELANNDILPLRSSSHALLIRSGGVVCIRRAAFKEPCISDTVVRYHVNELLRLYCIG